MSTNIHLGQSDLIDWVFFSFLFLPYIWLPFSSSRVLVVFPYPIYNLTYVHTYFTYCMISYILSYLRKTILSSSTSVYVYHFDTHLTWTPNLSMKLINKINVKSRPQIYFNLAPSQPSQTRWTNQRWGVGTPLWLGLLYR
jgi:hypothetical protein